MKKKFLACTSLLVLAVMLLASCSGYVDYDYMTEDITGYITLCDYKNLAVTATEVAPVTDEDVQSALTALIEENKTSADLTDEETIAAGDSVTFSYTGSVNGEEVTTETASGLTVTVGDDDELTAGLTDSLAGKKAGETYTVSLTLASDYTANTELSGSPISYSVTVESATRYTYPTADDAFIAEVTDYETLAEYKEATRASLEKTYAKSLKVSQFNALWNAVVENSTLNNYPSKLLKSYEKTYTDNYKNAAVNYYKISLEEYVTKYMGETMDEFNSQIEAQCKLLIKQELVFYTIVKNDSYTLTDEEFNAALPTYIEELGPSLVEQLNDDSITMDTLDSATFLENVDNDKIKTAMLWDKVMNDIAAGATFTYVAAETTAE